MTMGAHVSVSPNLQVGRITSLDTRFAVALSGNLGYEMDVRHLPEEEKEEIRRQIAFYKDIREVIQKGRFYRLLNPQEGNIGAWNFVSEDENTVIYCCFQILSEVVRANAPVKLKGLREDSLYRLQQDGSCYGGDELMYAGITTPSVMKDFVSHVYIFKREKEEKNESDEKGVSVRIICSSCMLDICGSLAGLLITGIVFIIFAPIIYIQSPGPIFFKQERVGKNGRTFKIIKFRSMYLDAEERKKELMEQNKMKGLMFKMDNDPRIIPIGKFMRESSLDELPQFWNILKGDMSLVGTRPPTVDEYMQYENHHKRRLAVKPGLTGMWQVSGRSDITDFEEVVALDAESLNNWNF